MHKKSFSLALLVMITSMILAACGGGTTQAPTAAAPAECLPAPLSVEELHGLLPSGFDSSPFALRSALTFSRRASRRKGRPRKAIAPETMYETA